jgi:[acyl-carrier-protein] S-malonyltransferase
MKGLNVIFPGQGSQSVGMGLNLYQNHKEARLVFEEVDDSLGFNLSKIIFEGPEDKLRLTENTQPALMATSIAIIRILECELKKEISEFTDTVLGHSLGEYSALCSVKSITLSEASRALKMRGMAMQESVTGLDTLMIAVIGLDISDVENAIDDIEIPEGEVCEIANDNCPGQVILSGTKEILETFSKILKEKGARTVLPLKVSAPFHCSLMNDASKKMESVLSQINLKKLETKYISNVTAEFEDDPDKIKELLVKQIFTRVKWRESIVKAEKEGISRFLEVGNGKVLTGMNKRISKDILSENISNMKDIDLFLKNNKDII